MTVNSSKLFKKVLGGVLSVSLLSGLPLASVVHAQPISTTNPEFVFDAFNTYSYSPDTNGYWNLKLDSESAGAPFFFNTNQPCSPSNDECLLVQNAGKWNGNLDFKLKPSVPSDNGFFRNIAVTDQPDGFSYGLPHKFLPTVNHPVLVSAFMKWSPNQLNDGTGGSVGTSGTWLWNLPADYVTGQFHSIQAIGWEWTGSDAFQSGSTTPVKGLSVAALNGIPTDPYKTEFIQHIPNVNLQSWNNYSILWKVNASGVQSVDYFVNGFKVASHTLSSALGTLAIEMWEDNEVPVYGFGQIIGINFPAITQTQDFYVKDFTAATL